MRIGWRRHVVAVVTIDGGGDVDVVWCWCRQKEYSCGRRAHVVVVVVALIVGDCVDTMTMMVS